MSPTSAHRAGFRDCGLLALSYLTDVARLDPNEPVVAGVRQIVDRGSKVSRDNRRLAPSAVTTRCLRRRDQENRKPISCDTQSTSRISIDDVHNGLLRHCNVASAENVSVPRVARVVLGENRLTSSPSSVDSRFAAESVLQGRRALDGTNSLTSQQCDRSSRDVDKALGEYQRPKPGCCSIRFENDASSGLDECRAGPEVKRDIARVTGTSDLVQWADALEQLARRDSRVELILAELMDLMDDESNDAVEA